MEKKSRSTIAKEIWNRPGHKEKMSSSISKAAKKRWANLKEVQKVRKLFVNDEILQFFEKGYNLRSKKYAYDYVKNACTRYNITPEMLYAIYLRAGFVCECCSKDFRHFRISGSRGTKTKLCIDHDHDKNIVRGLLCHSCNVALGFLEHDSRLCDSLSLYVNKHLRKDELDAKVS